MGDPILKAIHGAIVGVCLSDPATGSRFGGLETRQSAGMAQAVRVERGVLHYDRERVKSLTMASLKEALIAAVTSEP